MRSKRLNPVWFSSWVDEEGLSRFSADAPVPTTVKAFKAGSNACHKGALVEFGLVVIGVCGPVCGANQDYDLMEVSGYLCGIMGISAAMTLCR